MIGDSIFKTIGIWLLIILGGFLIVFGAFGLNMIPSKEEKKLYLSDLEPAYSVVGYGQLLSYNETSETFPSLKWEGQERKFAHGFFAHAYSTLVFDVHSYQPKKFTTYFGVNETARNNQNTSMVFVIYFDHQEVFRSDLMNGTSEGEYVELALSFSVNRITLVIDSLASNANDHGVWADCLLYYTS